MWTQKGNPARPRPILKIARPWKSRAPQLGPYPRHPDRQTGGRTDGGSHEQLLQLLLRGADGGEERGRGGGGVRSRLPDRSSVRAPLTHRTRRAAPRLREERGDRGGGVWLEEELVGGWIELRTGERTARQFVFVFHRNILDVKVWCAGLRHLFRGEFPD